MNIVKLAIIALTLFASAQVRAEEENTDNANLLRIAAASDLKFALDEIKAEFAKTHKDIELDIVVGSSGQFEQQIEKGAPFDLFLSADSSYPKMLKEKGVTVGDPFMYGKGHLVLWTKNKSGVSITQGLVTLKNTHITKIAIANPEHAPYGKAAVEALRKADLYESVEKRLVTADSVSQAAQFAQSGAADVGLIAQALAMAPEMKKSGVYVAVKEASDLEQSGIILKQAEKKPAAKDLKDLLLSAKGQEILKKYGLE